MNRHPNIASRAAAGIVAVGLLAALSGGGGAGLRAQQMAADVAAAALREELPRLMQTARIPGLQIALVREGRIVWQESFGLKNAQTKAPLTDENVFEGVSFSKPVFAYCVLKLADRGVLDLDKPLVGFVPAKVVEGFLGHPLDEPGFRRDWFEKVTARQVLSHTSGLPHFAAGRPYPLLFEPGTKYRNSADGYLFLQRVVEALQGADLDAVARKEVFEPLGMTRSAYSWRDGFRESEASPHDFFGTPRGFSRRTFAHAGVSLYTNAVDYARFMCAVLNGEGLRPESWKAMLTPQVMQDAELGVGWSLGFGTQDDARGQGIWIWGRFGFFDSFVLAYPAGRSAVVYMTNSEHGLGIASEVTEKAVGGPALGMKALKYWRYDSPIYRAGWELARTGGNSALALPDLEEQYPEAFSEEGLTYLAATFQEALRLPEAAALLRYRLTRHPESGRAMFELATVLMQSGDLEPARDLVRMAAAAPLDRVPAASLEWTRSYLQAMLEPKSLSLKWLKKLAGRYEDRHVALSNGRLYYYREGALARDYKQLFAIDDLTFVIRDAPDFRLRFTLDKKGDPIKLTGYYAGDVESLDEMKRTR